MLRETLARLSGDLDELVAVMSKDLYLAWHYLQIAAACKERGQSEQALDWAERGLRAFSNHTDVRLREFLAEEYHRLKHFDEAMSLIWAEFQERHGLESYGALERHAKKAGNWTEWRAKAIAEIRHGIESRSKAGRKPKPAWMRAPGDHSALVDSRKRGRRITPKKRRLSTSSKPKQGAAFGLRRCRQTASQGRGAHATPGSQ